MKKRGDNPGWHKKREVSDGSYTALSPAMRSLLDERPRAVLRWGIPVIAVITAAVAAAAWLLLR